MKTELDKKSGAEAPLETLSVASYESLNTAFSERDGYSDASQAIRVGENGDREVLSIVPELQSSVQSAVNFIMRNKFATEVAAVIMDSQGQILGLAESRAGVAREEYPTASLFKLLTTAAALDQGCRPDSLVSFHVLKERGYWDLSDRHFDPDLPDNDVMALDEALALSNNIVFAKIALSLCEGDREQAATVLKQYADKFGVNGEINSQNLPYAACGLSETYISPVNAAALMASIANGGLAVRPSVVQSVFDSTGELVFHRQQGANERVLETATAREIMEMARKTTCCYGFSDLEAGTARGAFFDSIIPKLKGVSVSAKTGSISDNGQKVRWFVATPETWSKAGPGLNLPHDTGFSVAVFTAGAVVPYVAPNLGKAMIEKLLRGDGELSLRVANQDNYFFL